MRNPSQRPIEPHSTDTRQTLRQEEEMEEHKVRERHVRVFVFASRFAAPRFNGMAPEMQHSITADSPLGWL
jgi:hypothetical protein